MTPAAALVSVVSVAIAAAVVWGTLVRTRRRREFLQARAQVMARLGLFPAPPNPWLGEVAARLFQRGRPGEMFAGAFRGRDMCVLDYRYTTGNGKSQQTVTVHLVALNLPALLPPLTVTRHSGFKRVFGGRGLELESKAFNDAFRIACGDDRFASAVLHPRMMEWLLFNPGLEWQLAGNALVSWGYGQFQVHDLLQRLEAMVGVADRIPPFVLRDYGQAYP
ncbi:hypothetical protein [Kribbella sp. NPDC055071]